MSRNLSFALCFIQILIFVHADGKYSIVGPGTIRSNTKYNVAVSLHKAQDPCDIEVGITGPSFNATKTVHVAPMSTENVEFDVPKLKDGDYNLTAKGISGLEFQNSTKLNYADFKPSTFIQTDKATYKPGDLVQFRVMVLDQNTRPAKIDEPISIVINDGDQNRIKQIKDVKLTQGVYTGKFQLSEQPVLGNWNIEVIVAGDSPVTKTFEVAKYVLPKFEVTIDTAKDVAIPDGIIKVTVRATYTYGKSVKGKATVSVKPSYHYYGNPNSNLETQKTIDVDGKGHVEFNMNKDLHVSADQSYVPPLKIFAEMEEELTGNKQNATATVTLHSQRYRIEGIETPYTYHPGKTITFKVVVKNLDGSPVQDTKNIAKLIVDPPRNYFSRGLVYDGVRMMPQPEGPEAKSLIFESNLDEHGMATFKFELPNANHSFYSVKCSFLDTTAYLSSLSKYSKVEEADEPLKLTVNTKKPRLGKDVSFEVKSNEPLKYFVYTITARGNILKTEQVEVPENRKSHTIKITPTFEMVPRATIYVHYVQDNNLRFEEATINFEKQFENSIDISAPVQAKPSEDVKLKITTDPDSFVGLLGVDQSVLLLKSGNDFSKDEVFSSLNNYDTTTPYIRGYGRYPGQQSGVVTLTNANYPYNDDDISWHIASDDIIDIRIQEQEDFEYYSTPALNIADDEMVSNTDSADGDTKVSLMLRANFADVWIFENGTTTTSLGEKYMYRGPYPMPFMRGPIGLQNNARPVMAHQLSGTYGYAPSMVSHPSPSFQPSTTVVTPKPQMRKNFAENWIFANVKRPMPFMHDPIDIENSVYSMLQTEMESPYGNMNLMVPRPKAPLRPKTNIIVPKPKIRKNFAENWIYANVKLLAFDVPAAPPLISKHAAVNTAQAPAPAPAVRKNFAEIWIFDDKENTDKDGFTLAKKIPDTITSWVITGFSLNPKTGFALTENPTKIQVFLPFFVSTNLPYSVKRGEVIAIPVIIFNYMDKALDAEVTMDNSDLEYQFAEANNEVDPNPLDDVKRVKRITIPSNTGRSVSFMIIPKNVGSTTLKISAITPLSGDSIQQQLKVEPEGVTQYQNRAQFINLKNKPDSKDTVEGSLKVDIPADAVPDSEYIEFSVVGDLLGPTIKNIDKLVMMPYGCGEQNMVNFVPNILVLKYLETINQNMPAITEKAKKFLEIGYQRELTYKHKDGSYSAFGESDGAGSTWLTAYVARSFHQAAKYTDIDPKVIVEALNFLVSKQAENGSFPEYGKLFDSAHQNLLGLTGSVLLAFLENVESAPQYESVIAKGMQYLAENVDKTDDQYALSIAAVALQQAKNPLGDKVLARLQTLAKNENDRRWWSKVVEKPTTDQPSWYWRPRSNDVEITSYVLLALLEKEGPETVLPIIKWLISQRNSKGGFSSTQDTVIGLQALIKFAEKAGSGSGDMAIDFVAKDGTEGGDKGTIKVNPENALVLQTHVLPKSTRQVDFSANGKGSAMVQLSYRFNLADKEKKPNFKVTSKVKPDTPPKQLAVDVCAEYLLLNEDDKKDSNMAVIEISLPSGYTADTDSFDKINAVDRVKRTETKNSDSTVIVYFDSLTAGDVKCVPLQATKTHAVAKQKPAPVVIYDYYDTGRKATDYYEVKSSLCDICEGDDCGAGCKKE